MENIQRLFQCQQGEVDWQEQLLEKDRKENEHLVSQMRTLQSNIESLNKEKQKLEEDCQNLEKKLSQTRRCEGGICVLRRSEVMGSVLNVNLSWLKTLQEV